MYFVVKTLLMRHLQVISQVAVVQAAAILVAVFGTVPVAMALQVM
jgi:hypothetical protein